jgi:O-phospho-L-seryl-tRNASec:L-selenocysteinyl-tRNA synthase
MQVIFTMHLISVLPKATLLAVVQSTDKNFLVPVGGAIIASSSSSFLTLVSSNYPGRASIAPILDIFITLLSMGESGYRSLLRTRSEIIAPGLLAALQPLLLKYGLSLIPSPKNSISYAVRIDNLPHSRKGLSFLGAMLFQRNVSGCRVVLGGEEGAHSNITGYEFTTWGAHIQSYPHSYFTVACAIGMEEEEIVTFISRLSRTVAKYVKMNTVAQTTVEGTIEDAACN